MKNTTLGIDLSSDSSRTAVCSIVWSDDGGEITHLSKGTNKNPWDDGALLEVIARSDKVGIDAPFGWPLSFVEAVKEWMRESKDSKDAFGGSDFEQSRLRKTDLQVSKPRRPLSVSSDRIAVTAMRCTRLIAAAGQVDRSGAKGKLMEVYPAAALYHWGLPAEGYKDGRRPARVELVKKLKRQLTTVCPLDAETITKCENYDDCLDALVAALVVRAFQLKRTSRPTSPDEKKAAASEGWIHIPNCQLGNLKN